MHTRRHTTKLIFIILSIVAVYHVALSIHYVMIDAPFHTSTLIIVPVAAIMTASVFGYFVFATS